MTLSFYLDDEHVPGTYDTRVGNDVLLHIFRDDRLVSTLDIPYAEIQSGKEYTIRKTAGMDGNLELVAWAVPPSKTTAYIPSCAIGGRLEDHYLSMEWFTRAMVLNNPRLCDIYLGRISSTEPVDKHTTHKVAMIHAGCRITVNITDERGALDAASRACANGTMSRMNMSKEGFGTDALVYIDLDCPTGNALNYTTGQFSVLPSPEGQELSIGILNTNGSLTTLTVPQDNMPRGAQAGDFIVFDYILGQTTFALTINGFRQVLSSVDM